MYNNIGTHNFGGGMPALSTVNKFITMIFTNFKTNFLANSVINVLRSN